MTTPGDGNAGNLGNGISGNNDSIIARIGVDLPDNAVSDLREIGRLSGQLQLTLEMNARFSKTIFDYTKAMPEIQETVLNLQNESLKNLREEAKLQEKITRSIARRARTMSGGAGHDLGPHGGGEDDPNQGSLFDGVNERGERVSLTGSNGTRGGRVEDLRGQGGGGFTGGAGVINNYISNNYITNNYGAGGAPGGAGGAGGAGGTGGAGGPGGGGAPGGPPGTGGPGTGRPAAPGTPLSGTNAIINALGGAAASSGIGGNSGAVGGLAGALGGALPGGAATTAGLWGVGIAGAAMGINKILEYGASIAAQGNAAHGGGFGEGLGYEMDVKRMAFNPFISTDQARQIVSSTLQNGFTGKDYDNVTDFMADNLKNMNIQVADSVKILQTAVIQGGQSIQSVASDLGILKSAAGAGPNTQAQLTQNYEDVLKSLTASGVDGDQISKIALGAANFGNIEGNPLRNLGLGARLTEAVANNSGFAMNVARNSGLNNVRDWKEVSGNLANTGQASYEAAWKYMTDWNKNSNPTKKGSDADKADPDRRMRNFVYFFQSQFGGMFDTMTLRTMFYEIEKGTPMIEEARDIIAEATGDNKVEKSASSTYGTGYMQSAGGYQSGGTSASNYGPGGVGNGYTVDNTNYNNKALDSITGKNYKGYGAYDPVSGQTFAINTRNKSIMDRISSGEFKLVQLKEAVDNIGAGSNQYDVISGDSLNGVDLKSASSLDEIIRAGGFAGTNATPGSLQGTGIKVTLEATPELQKYIKATATQSEANYANGLGGQEPSRGAGDTSADPKGNGGR